MAYTPKDVSITAGRLDVCYPERSLDAHLSFMANKDGNDRSVIMDVKVGKSWRTFSIAGEPGEYDEIEGLADLFDWLAYRETEES
jgi:hypothetical protein